MAMLCHYGLEKFDKAEELYRQALHGREMNLGAHHSDTQNCARNLAIMFEERQLTAKLRKLLSDWPDVEREEDVPWELTSQTPPLDQLRR